ncbi:MAG: pirin family protein [Cardiobacteriaceae bacterium]|nr:pirin family protein [Cardiobacteriaceae bacterium]
MTFFKLTGKGKDVGGLSVTRLLPQAKRRSIGAWCFLDHAGPAEAAEMQVGAHPHTNLATFTWMLNGEVWHADSLGSRQCVRPGEINLMVAGTGNARGISHTEQSAPGAPLHAVQLWIALPTAQDIAPAFHHYPELPAWESDGVRHILLTGDYQGRRAPTAQFSPLLGVDLRADRDASLTIAIEKNWEYGVLVIDGEVRIDDEVFHADELAFIACERADFRIEAAAGSHFLLLGGEPLAQPVLMWWNFVADSCEALRQAVADWNRGHPRFGSVGWQGETLPRLPAPEMPGG